MKYQMESLPTNLVRGHTGVRAGVLDKMSNNGPMTSPCGLIPQVETITSPTKVCSMVKNTYPLTALETGNETFTLKFGLCSTTQRPDILHNWDGTGAGISAWSTSIIGVSRNT